MPHRTEHWFGAKRLVKDLLSVRAVNAAFVAAVRRFPVNPTIARLPVAVREVPGHVRGTDFVLVNPSRCAIAKELFWTNGVRVYPDEQLALEVFLDLVRDAQLVLDVGANTGIFSILAALGNSQARVEAFEIVPEVFEVLFKNVIRNDVADRVACRFVGIGTPGFTMRVASTEKLSSLPTSVSTLQPSQTGALVAFQSLDSLCAQVPAHTRVQMKIDVEGTEGAIFANGWKTIERLHPTILCEILPNIDGSRELGDRLRALGYHLYKVTDDALVEHDILVGDEDHLDWYFCIEPKEGLRQRTFAQVR